MKHWQPDQNTHTHTHTHTHTNLTKLRPRVIRVGVTSQVNYFRSSQDASHQNRDSSGTVKPLCCAGGQFMSADSICKLTLASVALCQRRGERHWGEALENVHKVTSFGSTQVLHTDIHSPAGLNNLNKLSTGWNRQLRETRRVPFFTSRNNSFTCGD